MRRFWACLLCICLFSIPVQGESREKLVALTFDDGPSGRFTQQLLEGLEERNAKATFFLCGYRMEQYPELTQKIFDSGHEIGLHGYSHKSMLKMCQRDIGRELDKAMECVPEGCSVAFLRSPGGLCGKCAEVAAQERNLALLTWSIDPRDWATHDADAIEKEVVQHVRDGDVILLHDMSDSSVAAALTIIDELQEEGYRFVAATELARARGVSPIPGKTYRRF